MSRAPLPTGEHPPKPYAIMRSDSSDIRLLFFWTRYSSWFIHCVCWSAGVPAGRRGGVSRAQTPPGRGGHSAPSKLALPSSFRSNFSSLMPCCSSSRNVTSISSSRLWMACEGRAALARGLAPPGMRPLAAGWRGQGMVPGWGPSSAPCGYLGFAEPLHLGFPGPAGQRALPGRVFLLFPQVQALRRDGDMGTG